MGNRNALFHRANKLLAENEGHRFNEAERRAAISQAINGMTEENRRRGNIHRFKPGLII